MKTITTFLFILSLPLFAQFTQQDVKDRLDLIYSGKSEQVRSELPALLSQYPNDPGVQFLDASLTISGDEAVKKYQSIVDRYAASEWADDALYKVYQYYYAVGLYKTADAKLNQLNESYPTSIYAKGEVKTEEKIAPPIVVPEKQEVQQEQPVVESKPETVTTPAASSSMFVVQVGVFSQESKARLEAQQYSGVVGKQAIVFAKQSGGKTVYAIGFEGFETEQSAREFGAELKLKYNIDWFLVKR